MSIGMRSLAARIERLETVYNPAEVKVIFLDFFSDGEVTGCNGIDHYRDPVDDGFRVQRLPGESVDAFMDRAADIARAYYEPVGRNCLVLRLERNR